MKQDYCLKIENVNILLCIINMLPLRAIKSDIMVTLRPYQEQGIRDIFKAWNPRILNLMNVLFQMPTGTGKTTVFSEIVRRARLKEKKILIVVHRKELVEQIAERLSQFNVEVGIISGNILPRFEQEV